jgi:Skp family chaperone for outer membrane proteins
MHSRFFSPRFLSFVTRGLAALALVSLLASSSALHAQQTAATPAATAIQNSDQDSHLVTSTQLDRQIQASSAARQKQIQNLSQFLSTPIAEKAMKDSKIDTVQIKTAIPSLSDAELADLSARADKAQHDFAAGFLGTTALLLIILVILVIILVSVYH